jgi:hypothetical protein
MDKHLTSLWLTTLFAVAAAAAAACSGDPASPCDSVCECVGRVSGGSAATQCQTTCEGEVASASNPRQTCIDELQSRGLGQCVSSCSALAGSLPAPDAHVADIICGNRICEAGETNANCPADCGPVCGNNICEAGETNASCPTDCRPVCGNNICEPGETPSSCPADCRPVSVCGNGICEVGETFSCSDCSARLAVQNRSSYTVSYMYVSPCSSGSWGPDQLGSHVIVSGGSFTFTAIPPGCYDFRAETLGGTVWKRLGTYLNANQTWTWTLTN